jgi:ATP-dependent helicase/nuclease subunit A
MTAPLLSPAQKAAVVANGRDVLVTAGAGTGKTTVLVERIVERLRSGALASLDGLLVVTFTDKASREMRERIHRALRDDSKLRHLLPQLPRASISTIHAFCARFLRERFLEAGLEPGFRVLDESAATQAFTDALRRIFHDWYDHKDLKLRTTFRGMVEMAGFDAEGEVLRRAVRRLHDYARTTEDPQGYLESLLRRPAARTLEDLPWHAEMCSALLGDGGRWSEGTWTRGVRLYRAALDLASGAGKKTEKHQRLLAILEGAGPADLLHPDGQMALAARLTAADFGPKKGGGWIGFPVAPSGANQLPGFEALHKAAKEAFQHRLILAFPWVEDRLLSEALMVGQATAVLAHLVRDAEALYRGFKERAGFLDFSDLETCTLRLLRVLGDRARGIFRESLIDEFQDVNRLQEEILSRLVPEDGRFRVGDVKQSIYQFRLADPTIFLGLMKSRRAVRAPEDLATSIGPVTIYLGRNHRSRPAVLNFTNLVFERLFEKEQIGSDYEEQALIPAREAPVPEAPVEFHALAWADDGSVAAMERQARLAARRLRAMVLEEKVLIPRRDDVETPATWRDAAILLRTGSRAELFLRVLLEEGVPACLGAGGSLLEEEAVQDFRSLLRVVDNPRDDIAFAAVLRSPLFGFSDADLLRLRLARPSAYNLIDAAAAEAFRDEPAAEGSAFRPAGTAVALAGEAASDAMQIVPPALAGRLRGVLDRVRGWRGEAGVQRLGDFLRALLSDSGLFSRLQGMGNYAGHRSAIEKLLALGEAFESERGPSLHGFLARLVALESSGGIDGVPLIGEGEDAVAILTMHRAKGLEFPLVVVPQLEWRFRRDDLGGKIRVGRDWIGMRRLNADDWTQEDSWARRLLGDMQERAQREEEARILYVALTRARERLVLLGTLPRGWKQAEQPADGRVAATLRREQLRTAGSAMRWLLPIVLDPAVDPGDVPFTFTEHAADAAEVCAGDAGDTGDSGDAVDVGDVGRGRAGGEVAMGRAVVVPGAAAVPDARPAAPLPGALREEPSAELDALLRRIGIQAPFPPLAALGAAGLRGKYWVTELKTLADFERKRDLEAEGVEPGWPGDDVVAGSADSTSTMIPVPISAVTSAAISTSAIPPSAVPRPKPAGADTRAAEAAAQRGILYHTALSRLDLAATTPDGLDRQLSVFAAEPWWQGVPRDPVIEQGIATFFGTEIGRTLAAATATPGAVEREVPFSLKIPVRRLLPFLGDLRRAIEADPRWAVGNWSLALDSAWVLIQGRIDCLFVRDGRWCILDWKTDRLRPEEVALRARAYGVQMRLYREAVAGLWGEPGSAWLAFIASGAVVEVAVELTGEKAQP